MSYQPAIGPCRRRLSGENGPSGVCVSERSAASSVPHVPQEGARNGEFESGPQVSPGVFEAFAGVHLDVKGDQALHQPSPGENLAAADHAAVLRVGPGLFFGPDQFHVRSRLAVNDHLTTETAALFLAFFRGVVVCLHHHRFQRQLAPAAFDRRKVEDRQRNPGLIRRGLCVVDGQQCGSAMPDNQSRRHLEGDGPALGRAQSGERFDERGKPLARERVPLHADLFLAGGVLRRRCEVADRAPDADQPPGGAGRIALALERGVIHVLQQGAQRLLVVAAVPALLEAFVFLGQLRTQRAPV